MTSNGHTGKGTSPASAQRRASMPMNPAFITSAPGKVIVYGEHSVVYGKAAIAAAISLRSYLLVTTLSKSQRTISLKFPDIKLDHVWNIEDLPWDIFSKAGKKKNYHDLVTTLDSELVAAMHPHIVPVSSHVPEEERKVHQAAASAFLYLFLSLASPSFPGCIYTLRSTLPIGAGLGSSASVSVCMSSAILLQIRALSGPHPDQPSNEARSQIERINRWAFVAEMCIHGNPSGVDNTVASYGKAVLFKRTDYSRPPQVRLIPKFPQLPLLLINSKQSRSTATELAKVKKLVDNFPKTAETILEAMDAVTEAAHARLTASDFSTKDYLTTEGLGSLMNINHGLLVSLGVSHPRLERIRELVDTSTVGYTKLTGAGGGGCAITLLRPDAPSKAVQTLTTQLESENFEIYRTTLGDLGVGVLWPAVLRDQEIDAGLFLEANGNEAIESLVGIGGAQTGHGWKFWS